MAQTLPAPSPRRKIKMQLQERMLTRVLMMLANLPSQHSLQRLASQSNNPLLIWKVDWPRPRIRCWVPVWTIWMTSQIKRKRLGVQRSDQWHRTMIFHLMVKKESMSRNGCPQPWPWINLRTKGCSKMVLASMLTLATAMWTAPTRTSTSKTASAASTKDSLAP